MTPLNAPVPCDFVLCPKSLLDFSNLQCCVLEPAGGTTDRGPCSGQTQHYCPSCSNLIFGLKQYQQKDVLCQSIVAQDRLLLDGVDRQAVMLAANRLYPNVKSQTPPRSQILDQRGHPDHAFNYSSNSPKNHRLRAYKLREIENTLAQVARYEKSRADGRRVKHQCSLQSQASSDLRITGTRLAYMKPMSEHYKKQGLTRYDYQRCLKEQRQSGTFPVSCKVDAPPASPVKSSEHLRERICLCRELDDGTEVLKCSSELCPVGWFHLRCTDLERLPTIYQKFFCFFCSDAVDRSVIKELATRERDAMTGLNTPVTPKFSAEYPGDCDEDGDDEQGGGEKEEKEEEDDDLDTTCGMDSTKMSSAMREKIAIWAAVNGSDASPDVTPLTDLSGFASDSKTLRACSEMEIWNDLEQPITPDKCTPLITTDPTPKGRSILACPSTNHYSSHMQPTSQKNNQAPATSPLQPLRAASKPWGTPINLQKINLGARSPSPTRRNGGVEGVIAGRSDVGPCGVTAGSQCERKEAPVMLDAKGPTN